MHIRSNKEGQMADQLQDILRNLRNDKTKLKDVKNTVTARGYVLAWSRYAIIVKATRAEAGRSEPITINRKRITEENTVADLVKALGM
jgi:hypothetical protein